MQSRSISNRLHPCGSRPAGSQSRPQTRTESRDGPKAFMFYANLASGVFPSLLVSIEPVQGMGCAGRSNTHGMMISIVTWERFRDFASLQPLQNPSHSHPL
jgi:hypothetical protein